MDKDIQLRLEYGRQALQSVSHNFIRLFPRYGAIELWLTCAIEDAMDIIALEYLGEQAYAIT